ncbi:neuronal acetylcholine receptor subunit beta-3-like [Glandiceps talaboti]
MCQVNIAVYFLLLSTVGLLWTGETALAGKSDRRSNERKLSDELLNDAYQKNIRPVKDENERVVVTVDIGLRNVLELDEKTQILKTLVYTALFWNDEFLRWNASDFGGLESTTLPAKKIWIPDLTVFNSISSEQPFIIQETSSVIVHYDGNVTFSWKPSPATTTCRVDVYAFPRDTQKCIYLLGSWTYQDNELLFKAYNRSMDEEVFHSNGEWILKSTDLYKTSSDMRTILGSQKNVITDRSFLIAMFEIERKSEFYQVTLMVPCLMLGFLASLTFFIPYEYGNTKIGMGVTLFLSGMVFLPSVGEMLPATSRRLPNLGLYYLTSLVFICFAVIWNVFVLYLDKRMTRKVPSWLRFLTQKVNKTSIEDRSVMSNETHSINKSKESRKESKREPISNGAISSLGLDNSYGVCERGFLEEIAYSVKRIDRFIWNQEAEKKKQKRIRSEWHKVAVALDRIASILFIMGLIAINTYIGISTELPSNKPNLYDEIARTE